MTTAGKVARIDAAEVALRRLQSSLGYVRGSLVRAEAAGDDTGLVYLAAAEREMQGARALAFEAFATVDLATASPEPRS